MASKKSSAPRGGASAVSSPFQGLAFRRTLWLVALVAWAALAASLLSFDPADPPSHATAPLNPHSSITNWMGPVGAAIAYQSILMIGSGVWILVFSIGAYLALAAFRGTVNHMLVRAIGVVMVALAFSGFHTLLAPTWSVFPEGAGGLVAIAGVHELATRFGSFGAALWLTLMVIVGLTVAFDDWFAAAARAVARPFELLARLKPVLERAAGAAKALAPRLRPARATERENDVDDDATLKKVTQKLKAPPTSLEADEDDEVSQLAEAPKASPKGRGKKAGAKAAAPALLDESSNEAQDEDEGEDHDDDGGDEPSGPDDESDDGSIEAEASDEEDEAGDEPADKEFDPETLRAKMAKLPVRFAGAERRAATTEDLEQIRAGGVNLDVDKNYVFPGLDLLVEPEAGYEAELEAYVREQAGALESALHTYNIKGEVAGIESGPVITLYQVRLAPGTKVSAINAISSDIARSLKSVNIRVVSNTEGLDTVGIEVPNRKKEKVRLKELMTRSEFISKMKLPMFLGKDASGRPLIIDLATLPHLLIAGTTGSGKSVCMNAIIMGFLYTQKPSDMKLVLVDPKVVELSQFKDIPHLMCPVVTDMSKAAAILEWAVGKMDERYELLAEAGCRDISAYNSLGWEGLKERFNPQSEAEEARIPRKLPYMVFIIDELADLMMTNKEVEGSIVRIAQKARAVGIHLILATQRPQANVVTGLIKSNMPGRLSFKVASGMDSRIVLDQKGGEILLGQGDMLFITPRSSVPIRAQGTLVDDAEIRNVVRFVKQVSGPSFERQLVQIRGGSAGEIEPGSEDHEQRMLENAQEDPLFDRAVEIVLETKRGSVSLLQRRLAIGYTRASRLIELMGMAGIIGDHKGSVAREVSMTIEEWQAIKKQAEIDAAEAKAAGPKPPKPAADREQPKLFPEPVTAKDVIESKKSHAPADAPPQGVAIPAATTPAPVEEPPFELDAAVDDTIEEDEEAEYEEAEIEDEAALKDEAEDAEESDDESESEDDEYDYEYEYVEVDEDEELSEEYEVVDEAEAAKPEIVVKPQDAPAPKPDA